MRSYLRFSLRFMFVVVALAAIASLWLRPLFDKPPSSFKTWWTLHELFNRWHDRKVVRVPREEGPFRVVEMGSTFSGPRAEVVRPTKDGQSQVVLWKDLKDDELMTIITLEARNGKRDYLIWKKKEWYDDVEDLIDHLVPDGKLRNSAIEVIYTPTHEGPFRLSSIGGATGPNQLNRIMNIDGRNVPWTYELRSGESATMLDVISRNNEHDKLIWLERIADKQP